MGSRPIFENSSEKSQIRGVMGENALFWRFLGPGSLVQKVICNLIVGYELVCDKFSKQQQGHFCKVPEMTSQQRIMSQLKKYFSFHIQSWYIPLKPSRRVDSESQQKQGLKMKSSGDNYISRYFKYLEISRYFIGGTLTTSIFECLQIKK